MRETRRRAAIGCPVVRRNSQSGQSLGSHEDSPPLEEIVATVFVSDVHGMLVVELD